MRDASHFTIQLQSANVKVQKLSHFSYFCFKHFIDLVQHFHKVERLRKIRVLLQVCDLVKMESVAVIEGQTQSL